jgi:ABC-2 type transport system ATP-binding protein
MAVVEVRDLYKYYGDIRAVDGISLAVEPGEIFGMLGPNGAGKSTSVEIVEGIRKMDCGYVRVLGLDPLSDSARLRNRIGIQLQSTSLYPKLNVIEHLKMFGRLYERSRDPDEIIDLIGLRERVSGLSQDLSGGQQQRLSVGLAMINDPEIVFLDEPTTGMDPQARRHLWDVIGDMKDQGKTILLTTHYMEEAEHLCDRIAIVDHGQIIALDRPKDLIAKHFAESTITFELEVEHESDKFRDLLGVTNVTGSDRKIELFSADISTTIRALLEYSATCTLQILNLHVRRATLEDVFLKLTGRRIRD